MKKFLASMMSHRANSAPTSRLCNIILVYDMVYQHSFSTVYCRAQFLFVWEISRKMIVWHLDPGGIEHTSDWQWLDFLGLDWP